MKKQTTERNNVGEQPNGPDSNLGACQLLPLLEAMQGAIQHANDRKGKAGQPERPPFGPLPSA